MTAIDETMRLLLRSGAENYYGEEVTQLQHALQTAKCAREADADEETVLAALLHDIGHLLEGDLDPEIGAVEHDRLAMEWLAVRGFSQRLIQLVGGHVRAKRYLVATRPDYSRRLSPTSVRTLELQGGPMTTAEAAEFEAHPLFREMLRLRGWDERAKDPAALTEPLEAYRPLLERHLGWKPNC